MSWHRYLFAGILPKGSESAEVMSSCVPVCDQNNCKYHRNLLIYRFRKSVKTDPTLPWALSHDVHVHHSHLYHPPRIAATCHIQRSNFTCWVIETAWWTGDCCHIQRSNFTNLLGCWSTAFFKRTGNHSGHMIHFEETEAFRCVNHQPVKLC